MTTIEEFVEAFTGKPLSPLHRAVLAHLQRPELKRKRKMKPKRAGKLRGHRADLIVMDDLVVYEAVMEGAKR